MKKYELSYTTKNGEYVGGQIFTADSIGSILTDIESWGAHDIEIKSIESKPTEIRYEVRQLIDNGFDSRLMATFVDIDDAIVYANEHDSDNDIGCEIIDADGNRFLDW